MAEITAEQPTLAKRFITVFKFIFFLGLGLLIIWLSVKNLTSTEREQIRHSFRIADYWWVVLAIILGIFSHVLRALRWMLFFEPMGYKPTFKVTFYSVMVGYFANMAFPRLGEVTRCGLMTRYEKIPFQKALGTVITERAIDMIIFVILFFFMIFSQAGNISEYLNTEIYPKLAAKFDNPIFSRIFLIGTGVIIVILFFTLYRFRHKLRSFKIYRGIRDLILGFWAGLKSLMQIRRPLLFIFYSIAIWVLYFFMLYVIFFCFPETSSLSPGAGLSSLVLGSVGIMITPGGIGLYPAIIQETLKLYGVLNTTGLALGWIAWTAQTAMIIIVGSISLMLLSFKKHPHGTSQEHQD
jgi:glycosyltransferase 2 family protein